MARERLDRVLVERGLAETRERAQALILAGAVAVDGQVARRASLAVSAGSSVDVVERLAYVSRGGLKLAHALDVFGLAVADLTLADVGASTGGFTDCLLQRGARRVYAIDVGYGQLAWTLRQHDRVVVMERTHARDLEALPEPIDGAVIDVSFISLRHILPRVSSWLRPGHGWIVALVKPQFEAGRGQVGRGGVVRDPTIHGEVLARVCQTVIDLDWAVAGIVASPLRGPAGNREFLLWARPGSASIDITGAIARAVDESAEPEPNHRARRLDLTAAAGTLAHGAEESDLGAPTRRPGLADAAGDVPIGRRETGVPPALWRPNQVDRERPWRPDDTRSGLDAGTSRPGQDSRAC